MDKNQAIFNENDIPYKELELIGISKKQIWSLDQANITALLSGKRTSLLDLSFHDNNGEEISMKGKISLYWKDSNNAGVKVHPVRPEIMTIAPPALPSNTRRAGASLPPIPSS